MACLELLVEDDVVEGDRKPAAEDLDQRTVSLRQLPLGLQQHHDLAPAAGADVEHGALIDEFVLAAPKGGFDHRAQIGIERLGTCGADETAVAAGARQHRKIVVGRAAVAQHQDAGAIDVEERGDLRQHALGQALHRFEIVKRRGGVDDDFQSAPGLDHAFELLIAAQRRGERGKQLVGGEFRLRLVVVDVVLDDHAALGRLSGLPGAQDDADRLVTKLVADIFDEI